MIGLDLFNAYFRRENVKGNSVGEKVSGTRLRRFNQDVDLYTQNSSVYEMLRLPIKASQAVT